jgi:hypothetical protein
LLLLLRRHMPRFFLCTPVPNCEINLSFAKHIENNHIYIYKF